MHLLLAALLARSASPATTGFALDNGAVNYAPILVFGVIIATGIWWVVSAKNWFTGPGDPERLGRGGRS